MAEEKEFFVTRAFTLEGVDYLEGIQKMTRDVAKQAHARGFIREPQIADFPEELETEIEEEMTDETEALSFVDAMDRFESGDTSHEVLNALKFFHGRLTQAKAGGFNLQQFLNELPDEESDDEESDDDKPNRGQLGRGMPGDDGFPEDFPQVKVFQGLGFKSVADIQKLSKEDLMQLNGVGAATADKALAYGK